MSGVIDCLGIQVLFVLLSYTNQFLKNIMDLSTKNTKVEAGVKEIAVKAIENSNKVQMFSKETKE